MRRREDTSRARVNGGTESSSSSSGGGSRFRLQTARVSGFKSFQQQETITFGDDGLTCITGPNGSGKSTLLNAILFGLGETADQLGARQNAELASAAHAEVELVFRSVSRGVSDAKVSSAVSRATGQRTFAFNGQKLPKHRFDHFLRTRLGIATGNPFWRVSQDGIHQLLQASPHALHGTLCEVSGTKAINAHRSNALKQVARWRRSLVDIQTNIVALEEAVGREGDHLLAMDRVQELTAELDAIPRKLEALDHEIARAELQAAERLVGRLDADIKGLEASKNEDEQHVHVLQWEMVQLAEGGGGADGKDGSETHQKELLRTVTDLAQASTELKLDTVALREKQELNSKWGRILRTAKAEQVDLKARSVALRGRCAILKDRRVRLDLEVGRSRAQLYTGDGSHTDAEGALKAACQALEDHKASVARAEVRHAVVLSAASQVDTEVEEHRSQAAAATAAVDEVWARMREIGSPLHTAEDAEKYLRGVEDQRHVQRSRQLDLSRALESVRQSLAAAGRCIGAPEWCSRLLERDNVDGGGESGARRQGGSDGGHRHRGFLFQLFELRHEKNEKYFQSLASLLSGSLTVWVCDSSRHANEALDLARANSASLRVWPVERLKMVANARSGQGWQRRCTRMQQAMEWAERRWPGRTMVWDPASLVQWDESDEGVTAAMKKALGGWVITEDDEVSGLLLSELGASSITAAGVRHAPGEVIGGETQGDGAKLRAKMAWDVAAHAQTEGAEALEACAEGCRDLTRRLELGAELARLQSRRAILKKEADECAGRLATSETKADAARQKVEWANCERARLKVESDALGDNRNGTGDPQGILEAMRKTLTEREDELDKTRTACAQIDSEIGVLAEASMEALERENNAKEALGMSNMVIGPEGEGEEGTGERGGLGGGSERESGSGGASASASEATTADKQLEALKSSMEKKVIRVSELERARDDLMARVDEANVGEKKAGDRLSTMEEEIAEAKIKAKETGVRLKALRKVLKEAERRVRQAAARLNVLSPGDSGGGGGGGSLLGEVSATATPTAAPGGSVAATEHDRGLPGASSRGTFGETGGRGEGNADGMADKENVPAGFSNEELLSKKHELAAKEKLLSSELRGLRGQSEGQRRGKGPAVEPGSVDEVTVRQRQSKVGILKQQLESVLEGTRQLEAGILACEGRMHEANEVCYSVVRRELRTLFGALCRNKSADLVFSGCKLEDGLRLVVRNEATPGTTAAASTVVVERSPQELSGGQQALLGLALVLALSAYQAPPLCLMDEVDAALDETNQAVAARLVAIAFQKGQALCVSHHRDFHHQSGNCVAVEMRKGVSRVQRRHDQ